MRISWRYLTIVIFCITGALLLLWMPIGAPPENRTNNAVSPNGQSGHWDLIFNDDFDGNTLDANKWTTCYWWDNQGCTNEGNHELEWYLPQNVTMANSNLQLTATQQPVEASNGKNYPYTSGMITTGRSNSNMQDPARFDFLYGYVEVRVKIPAGKGLWPAIWMLPSDQVSKPEIDVMEMLGDDPRTVHMNFHYLDSSGTEQGSSGDWTSPVDLTGGWHTFAVNWQPNSITWYVDGVERRRFTQAADIPSKPMYLLLNLAVGGDWAGNPDASTQLPNSFLIDYVRVWKQSGDIVLLPTADAFVDKDAPNANFGHEKGLAIDGSPERISYLKFQMPDLRGKKITSAVLRVRTTGENTSGSANDQAVYQVSDAWDENTITYNNRPQVNSYIIGLLGNTEENTTYDISLSVSEIQKMAGQTLSLAMVAKGFDGLYIYSREFRPFYPELILNTVNASQESAPGLNATNVAQTSIPTSNATDAAQHDVPAPISTGTPPAVTPTP